MKKVLRVLIFGLLGIIVMIGGCGAGYFGAQLAFLRPDRFGSPSAGTYDPVATGAFLTPQAATMQALTGHLLIEDPQFSSSDAEDPGFEVVHTDQGMIVTNRSGGYTTSVYNGSMLPADVDASVTIQGLPPDPCDHWSYSLAVRIPTDMPNAERYQLTIWNTRRWEFWHANPLHPDEGVLLASGSLGDTFSMQDATRLRVVARASHYGLYIDGKQVGSANDTSELSSRNAVGVGLFICTNKASVLIKDLVVRQP